MHNSADRAVVDDVNTCDFPVGFGFMGPPLNPTVKYPVTILLLFSFYHNFVAALYLLSCMMYACTSWS
jgi:hypothetical protein